MDDSVVALVLVTHNSSRWLAAFFASWAATAARVPELAGRVEMIVADAGSTDDTRDVVRQLAPGAVLVELPNLGFGAAANRGVGAARSPWVLLCNPDLTFPEDF